jgi:hypothetical protein
MVALKAEKPAADEARGLPDADLLGGKIGIVANLPLSKFQAAYVTRRFCLSSSRAAVVAAHAFGEARP